MLTSLGIIFLVGILLGELLKKLNLPSLLGYLVLGMVVGPFALNVLDGKLLNIAPELRKIALVIILTRAGLSLNVKELKAVGRPALCLCFVPALLEIVGVVLIGPKLLGITTLDAAILGTVIAAVSPAVIVPRMLKLMEEKVGTDRCIPQMILAGASVDDVFVIVLFTAFTNLAAGEQVSMGSFAAIPVSIVLGIAVGIAVGLVLGAVWKRVHLRDSYKVLVILSVSFLLLQLEESVPVPMSGLLAIMTLGMVSNRQQPEVAVRIQEKYNRLWVGAEILLFVLVGATVDVRYAVAEGIAAVLLVVGALVMRMAGVAISVMGTKLNKKERFFCCLAYTPKATVQAAIGTIPLAMGLSCGQLVLTIAVLSILITAPFGAIAIDRSYKKLLG